MSHMEIVLEYLREHPDQVPILTAEFVAGAAVFMWFIYALIGFFRDSNKSQSTLALKMLESMNATSAAMNANSAVMAKNSEETAKYIAALNETLNAMRNDLFVIKDTTTAHRREFDSLQLQNRFAELAKKQSTFEDVFKRSQQSLHNNQKKIYESIQNLQSQLKNPSQWGVLDCLE